MNELTHHFRTNISALSVINRVTFVCIKCYSHIYFCQKRTMNTPLDRVRISEGGNQTNKDNRECTEGKQTDGANGDKWLAEWEPRG